MTATVFIIDDDASVRKSLSRLLRSEGLACECFESAAAYSDREPYDKVGCILLDINMPEMSGIEMQARLVAKGSDIPIVFLTGHGDISTSVLAMKQGALDFLTKPVDEGDLIRAIRQALAHHGRLREIKANADIILERIQSLTPREHEVMMELITGMPNKLVADHMDIAIKTVKVHRAQVMEKMGVHSVAELLHLCHLVGIEPDTDLTELLRDTHRP